MTIALQVLVSGLAAGGVYGLFAAGHSLIYRLTGIVHFAFGDLVGLGVFARLRDSFDKVRWAVLEASGQISFIPKQ